MKLDHSISLILILFLNCSNRCKPEQTQSQPVYHPPALEVVATGLEVPWGMDFLPDGRLLVNERPGRINLLDLKTKSKVVLMTRDIWDRAEGGLLGLAVDPQFSENHFIFIYETHESGNRIVRLKFLNDVLTEDKVLLDKIPKKLYHDGGILKFGPDGYLYAGTGDAREPDDAQDIYSTAGKILRFDRDGNIPPDNPFNNYVWSYGHRNVQGISWDDRGRMFATEHGPSGELNGWCCHDELNLIEKGKNYGWPKVIGSSEWEGTITPLVHSGEDTWAPGGIAYLGNDTFVMACLRGERIILFDFDAFFNNRNLVLTPDMSDLWAGVYGRIRNVIIAPDGGYLFCTSNRDGRGDVQEGDDKILWVKVGG